MARTNPINVDPTRTGLIRKRFMAEMIRRFADLRKKVQALVLDDDAFGLKPSHSIFNETFAFATDEGKVRGFKTWLKEQTDAGILGVSEGGDPKKPWLASHIESAYRQGAVRAYTDTHSKDLSKPTDFIKGTQKGFLESTFAGPVQTESLRRLYTRSFDALDDVTKTMGTQMSRILSDGLAHGIGPRQLAKRLDDNVANLTRTRALTIARTEIIYAHAEGQLDSLEQLGVEEVGVMVEWDTAGDGKVCPRCSRMNGVVLKIAEARGLIPRHPNCRCAWVPAFSDMRDAGQIRDKRGIQRAFKGSLKGESDSAWIGAGRQIGSRAAGRALADEALASMAPQLWNQSPAAVLRWMGADGWQYADARRVMDQMGVEISDATIKAQLSGGKLGTRGAPAALSEDQAKVLRDVRSGDAAAPGFKPGVEDVSVPPVDTPPPAPVPEEPKPGPVPKPVETPIPKGISVAPEAVKFTNYNQAVIGLGKHGFSFTKHSTVLGEEKIEDAEAIKLAQIMQDGMAHMRSMSPTIDAFAGNGKRRPLRLRAGYDFVPELRFGMRSGIGRCNGVYWEKAGDERPGVIELAAGLQKKSVLEPSFGTWTVGHDFGTTFRHEYGHRFQAEAMTSSQRQAWKDVVLPMFETKASKNVAGKAVSRYAVSNTKEMWAESFAAYTHPNYTRGSLPAAIEKYLDKHIAGLP